MNIPNRAPDFNNLFSSKAEFEAALESTEALGKVIAEHAESIAIGSKPGRRLEADQTKSLEAPSVNLRSSRRQSESIVRDSGARIVPAAAGRIEHMLLTVPSYFDGAIDRYYVSEKHDRHFRTLARELGDGRQYTVVCHPHTETRVRSWFRLLQNVRVNIILSPRFNYSIWAQDAYVALNDDQGTSILVEGISFPRYEDMTVADDVAIQSQVNAYQSTLYFQGGNILGGPNTTLIGKDYIWRNATRIGTETKQDVIEAFKEILGTDVRVLGGLRSGDYEYHRSRVFSGYGQQPIFHIDMYVTPTGVVGESKKEIVMLGRPQEAFEAIGMYSEDSNYDSAEIDAYFDETEEQLSECYEVRRLPLLLTRGDLNDPANDDRYYFLTFNNVVIESYDGKDGPIGTVIMPTYAEDAETYGTDAAVRTKLEAVSEAAWSSAGFTVRRSDGVEDLAHGDGSIHCITKALRRGSVLA